MSFYYHVSNTENAPRIQQRGFRVPKEGWGPGIYFWTNLEDAESYLWDRWHGYYNHPRWNGVGDPVILKVELTEPEEAKLHRLESSHIAPAAVYYPTQGWKRRHWRPRNPVEVIDGSYVLEQNRPTREPLP